MPSSALYTTFDSTDGVTDENSPQPPASLPATRRATATNTHGDSAPASTMSSNINSTTQAPGARPAGRGEPSISTVSDALSILFDTDATISAFQPPPSTITNNNRSVRNGPATPTRILRRGQTLSNEALSISRQRDERIDIMRIINELNTASTPVDDTILQEHLDKGSAQCGEYLTQNGVCMADLDRMAKCIRETVKVKFQAYQKGNDAVEHAKKCTETLESWLEDYDRKLMSVFCDVNDDAIKENLHEVRAAIEKMVKLHLEKNDVARLCCERAEALGALQRAIRAAKLIPSVSVGMQCYLCMDNVCDRAIVPCGHMLCSNCHSKSPRMRACYVCRSRVEQVLRLYMN